MTKKLPNNVCSDCNLFICFCSRVKKFLADGEVYMGGQTDEADKYIAPTVLHNVKPTDHVMQEEVGK